MFKKEENQGNIQYELQRLAVYDGNSIWPINENDNLSAEKKDQLIQERAQKNVLNLFHKLLAIKTEQDTLREIKPDELQKHDFERGAYEIDIPEDQYQLVKLPRSKKIPDMKKLKTRWEKFAESKGIKKHAKRSRMVYDEIKQDWVPRWGAYSVKKNQEDANIIIEHKEGDDPYEDPFKKQQLSKKLGREKQKLNEIRNKLNEKGIDPNTAFENNRTRRNKSMKKQRKETQKNLSVAQNSTASMGMFDKKAHPHEEKQKKTKKRKIHRTFENSKEEKQRDLEMLDFIQKNKGVKKVKKE